MPGTRGGVKERSGKSVFREAWLEEIDENGDAFKIYVQKTSLYSFKCTWCQSRDLAVDNVGQWALASHAKSKKHKDVAKTRREINNRDQIVEGEQEEDDPFDDNNNDDVNQSEESGIEKGQAYKQVISNFFKPVQKSISIPVPEVRMNLENKAIRAEIKIALKAVDSDWSYSSLDDICDVLMDIAPDSIILQKMKMKRSKLSYVISHGLGPHFHDILMDDLGKAPCFTLGLDSATTKQLGLSKSLDFKVRFFSERSGMVIDMFLDCHHVGHETADIMENKIITSLKECGISLCKLITLSRDNPTVMKSLDRKMKEKAEADGNPKVLSFPDYLHPTHTALREGMKQLGSDIEQFLVNAHGFFKLSTSRREDVLKLREIFEENDQFFIRFVSSRWLTTGPVAERVVQHWQSLTEYILTFLPSQDDKCSKDAMETLRYQQMKVFLKPANNQKNLARLHFLIHLCKLNSPFLHVFQSEKPKIHVLYLECIGLINSYMNIICKPNKVVADGTTLSQLNFKDSSLLLQLSSCFFGSGAEKEMLMLEGDKKEHIRHEFRSALIKTIQYLVSHFPIKDRFLRDLSYLDPDMRVSDKFVKCLVRAADHTGRFPDTEQQDLSVQLHAVKTLRNVRQYDEKTDQLDLFWMDICEKVEKVIGQRPEALLKFIKIVCSLPHSNGFLERGFSDLKRLITGRETLSLESTNAQKKILDFIRLSGGTTKVEVTLKMIEDVKQASLKKEQDMKKKEKEEEKKRTQRKQEEQFREKKRKFDDEKKAWEEKHQIKVEGIQVLKEKVDMQSKALTDALKTADETKKETTRKAAISAAMEAQKNVNLSRQLLEFAHKEMDKLLGKKPKLG